MYSKINVMTNARLALIKAKPDSYDKLIDVYTSMEIKPTIYNKKIKTLLDTRVKDAIKPDTIKLSHVSTKKSDKVYKVSDKIKPLSTDIPINKSIINIQNAFKSFKHINVASVKCEIVNKSQHISNINMYERYLLEYEVWQNDRNSLKNLRIQRNKIPEFIDIKRMKRRLAQSKNLLDAANKSIENEDRVKAGLKPKYSIHTSKLDIEASGHFKKMQVIRAYKVMLDKQIPILESDIDFALFDLENRNKLYNDLSRQIKALESICQTYVIARKKYLKYFKRFGFNGSKYHCVWTYANKRYQIMMR